MNMATENNCATIAIMLRVLGITLLVAATATWLGGDPSMKSDFNVMMAQEMPSIPVDDAVRIGAVMSAIAILAVSFKWLFWLSARPTTSRHLQAAITTLDNNNNL